MKRLILVFLTFIFIVPCFLRADEVPLSLDEAIAIALRDNRDILLKSEDVKKAKAKIAEARSAILPTLTFTGGWTDTRGYYDKGIGQTTTQTTLKQIIYKGGSIIHTIKMNEQGLVAAEAVLDKTKLETALQVKQAFYTLLLAREFADLNAGILGNTDEHLAFVKARYQSGQASQSDVLQLESSLEGVRSAYEVSANQVESARVLLTNLLYLEKDSRIRPEAEFQYEPAELVFDEAFLKVMARRPEIRQYEAQKRAAQSAAEAAKAGTRPVISASWDYYSGSHIATIGGLIKNWNDKNIIGLTFSWPIFDGFATRAKVEQALVDVKENQLLKEKIVNDIALELKNAYVELKNAIAKIKSTESEIGVYKDSLKVAQEKYIAGIASSLDLNDASLGYEISLFNQKQATYDYIVSKAKFDKATGGS